jgi:hypothetical protein
MLTYFPNRSAVIRVSIYLPDVVVRAEEGGMSDAPCVLKKL